MSFEVEPAPLPSAKMLGPGAKEVDTIPWGRNFNTQHEDQPRHLTVEVADASPFAFGLKYSVRLAEMLYDASC